APWPAPGRGAARAAPSAAAAAPPPLRPPSTGDAPPARKSRTKKCVDPCDTVRRAGRGSRRADAKGAFHMSSKTLRLASAAFFLALAGCGGASGMNPFDPGAGGGAGFSITVDLASYRTALKGGIPPASGRVFVDIALTIHNDTATKAVTANFAFFSLMTASSLQVAASAHTALAPAPC